MIDFKIGGACKWLDEDGSNVAEANFVTTTVRKLLTLTPKQRHEWMWPIIEHNLTALRRQLEFVAALPPRRRMWRISSELLPIYTHDVTKKFYDHPEIQDLIHRRLAWCGKFARKHKLRLSFHPGQFVVLGSQNPGIRENSRIELQYHCDVFTMMGYHGWHPDGVSVNIHVGVKNADVKAMRKLLQSSTSIANFTTLENDEFSWGVEPIIETFGDLVPVVLDVHHYWISEGKRLQPKHPLVQRIRETWRGVQPKLHLAMSYPELCGDYGPKDKMDLQALLDAGNTRAKLRVHSLHPWHTRSIDYAAQFNFDIMWEGKDKNLGAAVIADHLGV